MLGPNRINILESSVHVTLSTGNESSIMVSLRPQQLQSLVRLGSGLLELLGGRVEVGFRGGVSLDGLVNSLSARPAEKTSFSLYPGRTWGSTRSAATPKLTVYL